MPSGETELLNMFSDETVQFLFSAVESCCAALSSTTLFAMLKTVIDLFLQSICAANVTPTWLRPHWSKQTLVTLSLSARASLRISTPLLPMCERVMLIMLTVLFVLSAAVSCVSFVRSIRKSVRSTVRSVFSFTPLIILSRPDAPAAPPISRITCVGSAELGGSGAPPNIGGGGGGPPPLPPRSAVATPVTSWMSLFASWFFSEYSSRSWFFTRDSSWLASALPVFSNSSSSWADFCARRLTSSSLLKN
mmetsp:Transcript_12452/g.49868  ORF Transcript_12452/g.49868 Transcript_12452/m.49868 type:complete len:249 (+) Transcript_12452:1406-2152(+)